MAEAAKSDITFDKANKYIQIPIAFDTVKVQTLLNAIREYEAQIANLDIPHIANASGETAVGDGFTGITLELVDDWRIEFAARAGPSWVSVFVNGGNLVATNAFSNNPVYPTAFTQPQIQQSTSPTLVTTGGSALTAAQANQLAEIYKILGLDITDAMTTTATQITSGSGDIDITIAGDGITTSTITRQ